MFNIQPGTGLGLGGSKQVAFGLGYGGTIISIPTGGGGGYVSGYVPKSREFELPDDLEHRARILQEDQEVLEFIQMLIVSGIIE